MKGNSTDISGNISGYSEIKHRLGKNQLKLMKMLTKILENDKEVIMDNLRLFC